MAAPLYSSPLQIEHYWARIRIPGIRIHPSQCHPLPPSPPPPPPAQHAPNWPASSHSLESQSSESEPSHSSPRPESSHSSTSSESHVNIASPPSLPTPFFKPPPPSASPEHARLAASMLQRQAVSALTALFRRVLDLERKGALAALGRAAFWERVADGEAWLPPSGRRMRAYEVVVLVMEVEYARTEFLRGDDGDRGRDGEWDESWCYGGGGGGSGHAHHAAYDDSSTDEDGDDGGDVRTELESLVDEYTRVWEGWEERWARAAGR
jgi:hypothetical protein